MNIRYPVRKADGRDYSDYEELLTDLGKNAHGWWLLGVNYYWHGGIHVGMSSSPASVLDQDLPEKSVPLQFMMDGEVVAWRVNRDYVKIECNQERPLRQSGTFVLVRSVYKLDPQDESSWLTLFQLYMILRLYQNSLNARSTGSRKKVTGCECVNIPVTMIVLKMFQKSW